MLERLAEIGSPFGRVGITGYPETHPKIDDDVTVQAMWDKRRHATSRVEGLHIFTFNQVEQTETWRQRLLA